MKKKCLILYLLICCCISNSLCAQDSLKFELFKTIPADINFFTTDNQGNIYTIKENVLTKYDKTGKQLYRYSNKNFGNISFVDATNMLKILVFYKNYLACVFLDNTLSLNGSPISFDKLGFVQTQLACSSHNNGIWLYDQQNIQLVRLNQNLEVTQKTGNLATMLGIMLHPDFLLEYDNKVYLNNPETGILIFDIYGTYYKTIPVKKAKQIQPFGNHVYYTSGEKIKAYNLKTMDELTFNAPIADFKNFRLEVECLMLQTTDSIKVYTPYK